MDIAHHVIVTDLDNPTSPVVFIESFENEADAIKLYIEKCEEEGIDEVDMDDYVSYRVGGSIVISRIFCVFHKAQG